MKPRLVYNWPEVKDENDIIAKRIKQALDEYSLQKESTEVDTHKLLGIRNSNKDGKRNVNMTEMSLKGSDDVEKMDSSNSVDRDKLEINKKSTNNLFSNLKIKTTDTVDDKSESK
jgi:hypothetical protein